MTAAFRWTVQLIEDGHRFKGGEWRCADCRRRAFDLLEERQPCLSPTVEGEYLFIGGPLDGEWRQMEYPLPRVLYVAVPKPGPVLLAPDSVVSEVPIEAVSYALKRKSDKPILAYVFEA